MARLPLIVSVGGINAAGRSSFNHAYKRMICDSLSDEKMSSTWQDLANLMDLDTSSGITPDIIHKIKNGTLIRRIENHLFNPDSVYYHRAAEMHSTDGFHFTVKASQLPEQLPENWVVKPLENNLLEVTVKDNLHSMVPGSYKMAVSSAGQMPTGFDPSRLYNSRHHPRGLSMTVYGASDALNSMGLKWADVLSAIDPDQVSVYAGSALAQMDDKGAAGLFQSALRGGRVSSKMMALTLPEMPADFINSYMINSVGSTGTNIGACATFLYNLRQGIIDIKTGRAKVVLVGNSEAPVVPEIMEGFGVMGALATDEQLCKLDKSEAVNNQRACRPFSANAGFTIAESAQFMVLMDDELALKLGANVLGSVADVYVNADANKKSISAPGVGNYITVAKAAALAKQILGEDGVARTFVQAHGTGTPQNRVTESHILNEVAKNFGVEKWKVAAIKAYVGHSLGPAAADQIIPSLGVWSEGIIPGIKTIDHIAEDVFQSNLDILMDHTTVGEKGEEMLGAIINSKGFGGNNASALVLSPTQTLNMLSQKHGAKALNEYQGLNEKVTEAAEQYDQAAIKGEADVIYKFGESVMDSKDVEINAESLKLSEFANQISLDVDHDYQEYL